ncbi:lipocalin family protein [Sphingorhabdus lutea]|nr:lipocalin family protein [Sphingorhabdus lutea]
MAALSLTACVGRAGPVGNANVPQPAKSVQLDLYLGKWYEMARYEAPFQKGCDGVTADYSMRDDGKIDVVNRCIKDGKTSTAKGKAKLVDDGNEHIKGAKLKVSFFGPFYGDYWVLDRADDYSWSIVGEPSGRYLWMLTRQANPPAAMRKIIENRVRQMGYDWSLVRQTSHAKMDISDQTVFWQNLQKLCGQKLSGKLLSDEAADADFVGKKMTMHVEKCTDEEVRVPFHVETSPGKWDKSRTWVFTRTHKGVQLKHDHRHDDGTPDAVTNYGGMSKYNMEEMAAEQDKGQENNPNNMAWLHFPVDGESIANFRANGLDKSVTNIWSVGINLNALKPMEQASGPADGDAAKLNAYDAAGNPLPIFTYRLLRTGENARWFEVGFR